jgi:predicted CXXCH cytochrome family protein
MEQAAAHRDLVAFPGTLDSARASCGGCHGSEVDAIEGSLMHTGQGMVATTRRVLDGDAGPAHSQNLQSLGHTVADSLLRKQCASCHLGQGKGKHAVNATLDRGGGCLACHVAAHPSAAHPTLSAEVSTGRCFGCHSRSGRISLSYTGLAESDNGELMLADRRMVERMPADLHYQAGMGCSACHGGADIKGPGTAAAHKLQAVTAQCTDCHATHVGDVRHSRLTCSACHSQWAPQCYGCHLQFDESGQQWDHAAAAMTPGQWRDRRWDIRNALPSLGVRADDRIAPFVPGMIMTVEHPDWTQAKFFRLFAPLTPHTVGPSRSCASCHRTGEALGLGAGTLEIRNEALTFSPARRTLQDGLPADAWTNVDNTRGGRAPQVGQRPFSSEEMLRIFSATIQQDSLPTGGGGSAAASSLPTSNTGGSKSATGRRALSAPRSPTK